MRFENFFCSSVVIFYSFSLLKYFSGLLSFAFHLLFSFDVINVLRNVLNLVGSHSFDLVLKLGILSLISGASYAESSTWNFHARSPR